MRRTSKKEKYTAKLVNKMKRYAEKNGGIRFSRPLSSEEMIQFVCLKFANRSKNLRRRDENGAWY